MYLLTVQKGQLTRQTCITFKPARNALTCCDSSLLGLLLHIGQHRSADIARNQETGHQSIWELSSCHAVRFVASTPPVLQVAMTVGCLDGYFLRF